MNVPAPGYLEGQTLLDDQVVDCDVCIIGSGAGGAVAAAILQRSGAKVVVLEEGGYFTSDRFRMFESEAFANLYQEGGSRTTADGSMVVLQGKAVGGTTVVNWTSSFRTPVDVLERWRSVHGVGGFTPADLTPHFAAVESRLSIAPAPLEAINRNNRVLYDGCLSLGYAPELIPRNVRNCIHSGYCGMGCPVDAKQSMLVSYLPDAIEAGATVISRCRVERLVVSGDLITGVEGVFLNASGRAPTGVKLRVRAPKVILSAGAIGSPAILLRSGIADPHKRIGVRTFVHPVITSGAEYPDPIEGYYGAPQSVAAHAFLHRGAEVGYLLEAAPVHPGLTASSLSGFGDVHSERMERLPYIGMHLALSGDGLHDDVPGGQVKLRGDGTPALHYSVAPRTWAALRHAQKTLARVQLASGAKEVFTFHDPSYIIRSERDIAGIDDLPFAPLRATVVSAHVMGGCGMSDDPKQGVVRSEDARHHALRNLYVMDGSLFPTGLGVNPQESIYGIAHLMATRLAGQG